VVDDLDVPGVEGVLVESHVGELREVERHRSHRGAEPVTVVGCEVLEPAEQRGVRGWRLVALRGGLLAFPVSHTSGAKSSWVSWPARASSSRRCAITAA